MDIEKFVTAIKYFLHYYLHSKRFLFTLIALLVLDFSIIAASIALPDTFRTVNTFLSTCVAFLLGVMYPIIFGILSGDLVAEDFEKSRAYFTFTLPLSKRLILLSKIIANIITAFILVSIYNVVAIISALAHYGNLISAVAPSYALQLLYAVAWILLSAMIGGFCKNSKNAIKLAVIFNFFIITTIGSVLAKLGMHKPWFILYYVYYTISTMLASKWRQTLTYTTSIGRVTVYIPPIPYFLTVTITYIAVCFTICYILYTKREIA